MLSCLETNRPNQQCFHCLKNTAATFDDDDGTHRNDFTFHKTGTFGRNHITINRNVHCSRSPPPSQRFAVGHDTYQMAKTSLRRLSVPVHCVGLSPVARVCMFVCARVYMHNRPASQPSSQPADPAEYKWAVSAASTMRDDDVGKVQTLTEFHAAPGRSHDFYQCTQSHSHRFMHVISANVCAAFRSKWVCVCDRDRRMVVVYMRLFVSVSAPTTDLLVGGHKDVQ